MYVYEDSTLKYRSAVSSSAEPSADPLPVPRPGRTADVSPLTPHGHPLATRLRLRAGERAREFSFFFSLLTFPFSIFTLFTDQTRRS